MITYQLRRGVLGDPQDAAVGANEDHVERDVGVLHPHRHVRLRQKSNSMPRPSGSSQAGTSIPWPVRLGVRITSTENTWTPDFETISSASRLAARTAAGQINSKATGTRPDLRPSAGVRAKKSREAGGHLLWAPGRIRSRPRRLREKHIARGRRVNQAGEQNPGVMRPEISYCSGGLVRRQSRRAGFRLDLGRHQALRAGPVTNQHILAGPQLGHAVAAQSFHMHEDIRSTVTPGQETETAQAVEPLDLRPLQPAGRRDADMGAWRQHLRGMDRGQFIHGDDAECLVTLRPLHALRKRGAPPS